jgi:hypothetical protein
MTNPNTIDVATSPITAADIEAAELHNITQPSDNEQVETGLSPFDATGIRDFNKDI